MILDEIKFKRQLGSLQGSFSWAVVSPYATQAERWFKKQVGQTLYDYLQALTPTENQLDEKELISMAEGAIAFYAFSLLQPRLNLKIGDSGMMKLLPANHVAITKWEFVTMADSNQNLIDICMDGFWDLVSELEPESWKGSDDYKVRNELFLKDAAELTEHLPLVNKSTRMYESLKMYIKKTERDTIRETITPEVFEMLKAKLKGENETALSNTDLEILELIKDAAALKSLLRALPYISILVDSEGIRQVVKLDGTRNEIEASHEAKAGLLAKLEKDTETAINKLFDYLKSVATENLYPSFFELHAEVDPFDIFQMEDDQHPIL